MMMFPDSRRPLSVHIAKGRCFVFDPCEGNFGKYRSRDPLSVADVIKLILSKSELKGKPLFIQGERLYVNEATAEILASIADEIAHGIEQPDLSDYDKWSIVHIWTSRNSTDFCRLGLLLS